MKQINACKKEYHELSDNCILEKLAKFLFNWRSICSIYTSLNINNLVKRTFCPNVTVCFLEIILWYYGKKHILVCQIRSLESWNGSCLAKNGSSSCSPVFGKFLAYLSWWTLLNLMEFFWHVPRNTCRLTLEVSSAPPTCQLSHDSFVQEIAPKKVAAYFRLALKLWWATN